MGKEEEGGQGWGVGGLVVVGSSFVPLSASPAWPPPDRLDPCRPGRASQTTR